MFQPCHACGREQQCEQDAGFRQDGDCRVKACARSSAHACWQVRAEPSHLQSNKKQQRSQNRYIDHQAPAGAQAIGSVQHGRPRMRRWSKRWRGGLRDLQTDPATSMDGLVRSKLQQVRVPYYRRICAHGTGFCFFRYFLAMQYVECMRSLRPAQVTSRAFRSRWIRPFSALALFLISIASAASFAATHAIPVESYRVVHTYPHDATAFTQGLVFVNGMLNQSTGSTRPVEFTHGRSCIGSRSAAT